jgi:hypothetical protein
MKTLSCVLLLMASLAFVLVGCSDSSTPPVSPTYQQANGPGSLAKVTHRPLSEYLNARTWASIWSNGDKFRWAYYVDDAGAWNRDFNLGLGSTFEGNVTERPLADGTAEVTVEYHSHNVLTYMRDWSPIYDPGPYPLVLGAGLYDVADGATPTLGDAHVKIVFINSAPGAPLPDFATDQIKSVMIEASAFGPLRAAAGMGPDGTPGHGWTNQTGLFQKILFGLKPEGQPGTEIYTAEIVNLQRVGASHK